MNISEIRMVQNLSYVFYAMRDGIHIVIKLVNEQEKITLFELQKADLNNVVKIYDIYNSSHFYNNICDLSKYKQNTLVTQPNEFYESGYTVVMEKLIVFNDLDFIKNELSFKQHFFTELEKAINQIHSIGIYHGDLKLQYIGYINDTVKLFDFGQCGGLKNKETDIKDLNTLKKVYLN